jgi:hypothetical protein
VENILAVPGTKPRLSSPYPIAVLTELARLLSIVIIDRMIVDRAETDLPQFFVEGVEGKVLCFLLGQSVFRDSKIYKGASG